VLLLQVTNREMPLRCRVYSAKTEIKGRDGGLLFPPGFDRLVRTIYGSAGVRQGREAVETSCLDRGETGYLELDQVEGDPTDVSITLSSEAGYERPAGCVGARSYAVDSDRLSVEFGNDGRAPIAPRSAIAMYLLLDDAGELQQLGAVVGPNDDPIEPGASVTYEGPFTYAGASRRLLAMFMY
jgi:hypothetical protein